MQYWPEGGQVAFAPPKPALLPSMRAPSFLTTRMSSAPSKVIVLSRMTVPVVWPVPWPSPSGVTATAMRSTWSKVLFSITTSSQVETGVVWLVWTPTPALVAYQPPDQPLMWWMFMSCTRMWCRTPPEPFSARTPDR